MVVRMDKRKIVTLYMVCIVFLSVVATHAYGCEEEDYEKEDNNCDDLGKFVKTSSSLSFFDRLLDKYPLLDNIIELILELIYNWLSNYNLNLG